MDLDSVYKALIEKSDIESIRATWVERFASSPITVGCQRFWTVLGPRDWGEEAPGLRVSLTS